MKDPLQKLWGDSFTLRKAETFKEKKQNWYAVRVVFLLAVVAWAINLLV